MNKCPMSEWSGQLGDFVGAMHMNLQADNAYLWYDDEGDLDVGIFDWRLCKRGESQDPSVK